MKSLLQKTREAVNSDAKTKSVAESANSSTNPVIKQEIDTQDSPVIPDNAETTESAKAIPELSVQPESGASLANDTTTTTEPASGRKNPVRKVFEGMKNGVVKCSKSVVAGVVVATLALAECFSECDVDCSCSIDFDFSN